MVGKDIKKLIKNIYFLPFLLYITTVVRLIQRAILHFNTLEGNMKFLMTLNKDLIKRLDDKAKSLGFTRTGYIRMLIVNALEKEHR